MKSEINARIAALRDKMCEAGVGAAIIPQTDPHQSEYIADHWQTRRWLSGFTGSAGSLVVTMDEAFVWADSRYWLQAARQLAGTVIGVMEEGKPDVPEIAGYLLSTLPAGSVVGIDGMLFSIDSIRVMGKKLSDGGLALKMDFNPIGSLWLDRPTLPDSKVFIHEEKYAGESVSSKIDRVLDTTAESGANSVFISDLAEIAWLLNIRARDVECNPVVTSFLYVAPERVVLFIDDIKLTDEVKSYLSASKVIAYPYGNVDNFLRSLSPDDRVLVSPSQTAGVIASALGARKIEGTSPVAMFKGMKNEVQVTGVRNAMVRDGVALVKSFMEIERRVASSEHFTEMDVAAILLKYRSGQPLFFDLSFETIAGYRAHGAIVHYSATPETNALIDADGLLLVDSGANYLDGTTDITRTVSLGNPTEAQRHDFTLVMKGHISLAEAVYPVGTRGAQLDVLARINLWKEGLSYLHGTGHGVGHFLNVHEGPQNIRLNENPTPLMPGMITSDEPGLYREGEYGIRCENLVLTVPAFSTEFGDFLKFETLTLFPFDLALFDTSMMSDSEIDWVNNYHAMVRERLLPHLAADEQEWLVNKTRTLIR